MPVCSSGISQARSGVPAGVIVDAQYIESILPAGLSWLFPYLPWMQGLQIGDVGAFCSVDPPTWTVPTGPDIFAFITGGPLAQVAAVNQFIIDITRAYIWYNLCECASVATPAAPAAPAAPANLPSINNPNIVQPNLAGVCYQRTWPAVTPINFVVNWNGTGDTNPPSTNTIITLTNVETAPGSGNFLWTLSANWQNSLNQNIRNDNNWTTVSSLGGTVQTLAPPANWAYVNFLIQRVGGSGGASSPQLTTRMYCNGATPFSRETPCCPPDPTLMAMLRNIQTAVTLIQRQNAPFGYVSGAVHSGLSGTGVLSVSGILGVLVNASVPASVDLIAGTPDSRPFIGRLNFATADGYTDRHALVVADQVLFPSVPGVYTNIGYTLEQGATMTLTELVREP